MFFYIITYYELLFENVINKQNILINKHVSNKSLAHKKLYLILASHHKKYRYFSTSASF